MRFRISTIRLLVTAVGLGLAACSTAPSPAASPRGGDAPAFGNTSVRAELSQILDDYWQHLLSERIDLRITYGLPITHLPRLSSEYAQAQAEFARAIVRRLDALPQEGLSHDELLSLQILRWEAEKQVEGSEHYWLQLATVTPYASPLRIIGQVFGMYAFGVEDDTDRFLALLRQLAPWIEEIRDGLEARRQRGIVLPAEAIDLAAPLIASYSRPVEQSPFGVVAARLTALDAEHGQRFTDQVAEVIGSQVNPALDRLAEYLRGEYRQAAPAHVGLWQYPGGPEFYRYLVRYHTTLDIGPDEVHRIGLAEVERINREMAEIRAQLGFHGTKEEFHAQLRTDPRFFATTPDEVGAVLMKHDERIHPEIPRFFLRQPAAPYGVRRLDPRLEPVMTYGYYQRPTDADSTGYYLYNGSNLSERSLLFAAALIYHELVPGHHFQFNLQFENTALPDFRRETLPTAFVEGWAEYASELAGEMGMYEDPYDRYGRLSMDMFLASRLVVDTGMHYHQWPRQRAIEFMRANTLESDTQLNTETLRYSTDLPGQALAYKMGSLTISDLRRRAEKRLGQQFDVRTFHDVVLGSGAMPLVVLEQHIEHYIARQLAGAAIPAP